MELARENGDSASLVEAYRVVGTVAFFMGDFPNARAQTEKGIELYDPEQHRPLAFVYGADPGVVCGLYNALSLWMLGYPERAQSVMDPAIARMRELSHGHTEAFTWCFQAVHHHYRREAGTISRRMLPPPA